MSSEKPFWEGKTCEEMAGLHIKVTFKNGDVATGVTDKNGDIKSVYVLTLGMGDDLFVPQADIESIELVDDPEYERIDNIEDVREGDIFVAKDGNHYPIKYIGDYGLGATFCVSLPYGIRAWLDDSAFSYALRPKPQLPDHDGLWLDKGDGLWLVTGTTVIEIAPKDPPAASISYPASSIEASERLSLFAPFRPAKAVEA
jgi:hypothetical protein